MEETKRWYSVREGANFEVIHTTEQAAMRFEQPPLSELGRPFKTRQEADHHKREWQKCFRNIVNRSS